MADVDVTLAPRVRLGSADLEIGATRIRARDDLAFVSVAIPQSGENALSEALNSGWGLALPDPNMTSLAGDIRAVRTAPDQMLLLLPNAEPDAERRVRGTLGGTGYTTDQTDAWIILELAGPDLGAALERLSPVDLSPMAFPVGAAARTVMEHMGVLVVRTSEDAVLLASAASSAESFLHAIEVSVRNVQVSDPET